MPSEQSGGRCDPPPGSLVAPDGSPGPLIDEGQVTKERRMSPHSAFRGRALQTATACITSAWHTHPVNHVASCSDPEALLPTPCHDRYDGR